MHTQREHAEYLAGRGAHYLLIVKRNQPGLHAQLAALPWRDVPVACTKRERGHGRTERRTLKVTAVARGLAFPRAARAIRITVITILRLARATSIAAALRYHARRPTRPLQAIMKC